MKRYYLSKMVAYEDEMGLGWIAKPVLLLPRGVGSVSTWMPPAQPDGSAGPGAVLCVVNAPGGLQLPLLSDAEVDALPDFPLDAAISGLGSRAKSAMQAALSKWGFDPSWPASADWRQVIQFIGDQIAPGFSAATFDAQD